MGFKTPKANSAPQFTGIQINTASSIRAVPLAGGMVRMGWNLIDYTDFQSHKHKQKAGKGFGGSTTTYTYTATIVGLLCVGEVDGVGQAWKDNGDVADYASAGLLPVHRLHAPGALGLHGRRPSDPRRRLSGGLPGEGELRPRHSAALPTTILRGAGAPLQHRRRRRAARCRSGALDRRLPDQCDHGVGFQQLVAPGHRSNCSPDDAATTTGDSAYQTYCRAMGFGISPP
jgi:hypothetical protein